MDERIHISCTAEPNYMRHSAAMLASALEFRGDRSVEILYLHPPRFPRRGRESLTRMVENRGAGITFTEVPDSRVSALETRGFTGKATWYRVFLPELAPVVGRTLWIDVDALVVDDLGELWDTDLGSSHVGAVTNVFQENHLPRAAKLGIAPREYFNAGVALLDLDAIRRDGLDRKMVEVAHGSDRRLSWRDQDTLNLALGHSRLHLHPRWNCMNSVMRFESSVAVFGERAVLEARNTPGIRHFEGPGANKPWHEDAEPVDQAQYRKARAATPWPRVALEGSRLRDRLAPTSRFAKRVTRALERRLPTRST